MWLVSGTWVEYLGCHHKHVDLVVNFLSLYPKALQEVTATFGMELTKVYFWESNKYFHRNLKVKDSVYDAGLLQKAGRKVFNMSSLFTYGIKA